MRSVEGGMRGTFGGVIVDGELFTEGVSCESHEEVNTIFEDTEAAGLHCEDYGLRVHIIAPVPEKFGYIAEFKVNDDESTETRRALTDDAFNCKSSIVTKIDRFCPVVCSDESVRVGYWQRRRSG